MVSIVVYITLETTFNYHACAIRLVGVCYHHNGGATTWQVIALVRFDAFSTIARTMYNNVLVHHVTKNLRLGSTKARAYIIICSTWSWSTERSVSLCTHLRIALITITLCYDRYNLALGRHIRWCQRPISVRRHIASSKAHGVSITSVGQSFVNRHKQWEVRLHGEQISAVELTQRSVSIIRRNMSVVSVNGCIHYAGTLVKEHRTWNRCKVRRCNHVLHYINHTVVSHEHLFDSSLIVLHIRILREHLVLCSIHYRKILAGHSRVERFLHQVVNQLDHKCFRYV